MDLREKPGKIQSFLEIMLRIRLISIVAIVVASISFMASSWQGIASLPLGASEALGMWMAEVEGVAGVWANAQYLSVAAIAAVVLFAIFGSVRGAVASAVSFGLAFGALYILGGNENMPVMMFGALAIVSLVALVVVKVPFACGLFPFVLAWIFWSGLCAVLPASLEPTWLVWAVLSALGFASAMSLSAVAGKHLSAGVPAAGALVKAAKQMFVPVLAASLLAVCAVAFDMPAANAVDAAQASDAAANAADAAKTSNLNYWGATLYFFVFNLWFFVLQFPIMSFAPWERLRSGSRRVEMKDKKKAAGKKNSKKK